MRFSGCVVLLPGLWYNKRMTLRSRLLLAFFIGVTLLLVAVSLRQPDALLGRGLTGDELLRTQIESDFDRDGDVDFLDFTVFSAFYEEDA